MPVLVAALWSGLLASTPAADVATQRSLVFLGGPLVLLAGLHARLFPYLHAPARLRWLPAPITAARHWRSAGARHPVLLGVTVLAGCLAVVVGAAAGPGHTALTLNTGVAAADFVWLSAIVVLLEPAIAGLGAALGRRFPDQSSTAELQRNLGGGWTSAEAVVHLYGPALGIGLGTLLAMPGQLGIERWADTGSPPSGVQLTLALAALPIAVGLRLWAPRAYARGLWEAVPWLAEATATLAGPPLPEPTPAWLDAIPDPWARLVAIQFVRTTPLPLLRLLALVAVTAYLGSRAGLPTGPALAVALGVCGLWLAPLRDLHERAQSRARLAAALPLGPRPRAGRAGWLVSSILVGPPVVLVAVISLRWLLG